MCQERYARGERNTPEKEMEISISFRT
jgi:hypothetical protein